MTCVSLCPWEHLLLFRVVLIINQTCTKQLAYSVRVPMQQCVLDVAVRFCRKQRKFYLINGKSSSNNGRNEASSHQNLWVLVNPAGYNNKGC